MRFFHWFVFYFRALNFVKIKRKIIVTEKNLRHANGGMTVSPATKDCFYLPARFLSGHARNKMLLQQVYIRLPIYKLRSSEAIVVHGLFACDF